MSFEPLRILVAFAWLAAAFLHGLGAGLADEGVQFLARLGGWQGGDSKPGPRTFATGIAHLASYLTVATYAPQLGGDDALTALAHHLLPAP